MPYVVRVKNGKADKKSAYYTRRLKKKNSKKAAKRLRQILNENYTDNELKVEISRRQDAGQDCQYQEREVRICPTCGKEVYRDEMDFTRDCHGIPFRLVCWDCYTELMAKGYDGEYYDERDEQIEDDY